MPTDLELEPAEILEPDANNAIRPSQSTPMSRNRLPPLTVSNANKMIQFFQENPRFLANKYTSQAANNMLAASTKIVGMSIQLERVNNQTAAAKAQNEFASAKIKGLSEVSQYVPVDDVEGQTELGRLNGMVGTPDFNLTDFANGVSRLQSKYKKPASIGVMPSDVKLLEFAQQYRDDGDEKHAAMLEAIVTERGRNKGVADKMDRSVTVTETGGDGKKITRRLTPEEAASVPVPVDAATAKLLSQYAEQKAALLSGDKFASWEWLEIGDRARKLNELKIQIEQKGINPDTATRLTAPPPTGTTNAPSATSTTNAPAASSAIPMPSVKTELVPGTRYSTPRGEATWDGEKFVK